MEHHLPQPLPLHVLYEDADLLLINKPAGLVVHPGAGVYSGTLLNALLAYSPLLQQLPRAGIVHRLDKGTSGVLMVAKNQATYDYLVAHLQRRAIRREYYGCCLGTCRLGAGTVDRPIGRDQRVRTKMAVQPRGREAITHYELLEQFRSASLLRIRLETGRTHQIRVHMAYLGHPLIGDVSYGAQSQLPAGIYKEDRTFFCTFLRPALHAYQLTLPHPKKDQELRITAPLPEDLQHLLQYLREH